MRTLWRDPGTGGLSGRVGRANGRRRPAAQAEGSSPAPDLVRVARRSQPEWLNFMFPETNATYWIMPYRLPEH